MTKKKMLTYSASTVILALAFAACAATPASAPATSPLDELSRAIRDVSNHLNGNVPAGRMIAFVNVQSGSVDLSNFIIDDLIANAVTDRVFTVVDRQRLDYIRAEQNIQLSGEVDDETARSIGSFLGAHTIVSGRVSSFGGYFRLTIRALEVNLGGTFAVGDVGPAGGIIFYDRGRHIDGWRWLEAASRNLVAPAEWGVYRQNVIGTSTALGTGRQNTQILVNHLRQNNESGRAAELAQNFTQNGFTDWFLPSREELNLMHINLRQRGQGNFTGSAYWSSSQQNNRSAWFQNFEDGRQSYWNASPWWAVTKRNALHVRPIRAF